LELFNLNVTGRDGLKREREREKRERESGGGREIKNRLQDC